MKKIGFGCIIILCFFSFLLAIKYWREEKLIGVIQFIISTFLVLVTIGVQIWPQKAIDLMPGFSEIVEENVKLKDELNAYVSQIDNLKIEVEKLNNEINDVTNKLENNESGAQKSIDNLEQETDDDFVDITTLYPLIGSIDDFFIDANGVKNNLGEECNGYMLFCCASSYSEEITFALDDNFTLLETTLSLRSADNDLRHGVWIEFYSIKDEKEISIGESIRFKAGTRPTKIQIPLEGVTDLKIKTNSPSIHDAAFLLTEGIFIK